MNRASCLIVFLALPVIAGFACGQNAAESERQFIEGMRSRGYSKLALEYLDKLNADPKLDPALKALVPMEIARTRMALAQQSPLDLRQALYARPGDLEKFAAASTGRPAEVQANMQIARIVAFQGKAQLSRAVRQETLKDRIDEANRARDLFEDAGKKLTQAVASLDAQMVKYKGSTKEDDQTTLEALKRDKLQAEFDLALNILLQSQTYILNPGDKATEKRGILAQEAEKRLRDIVALESDSPLCQKARVWLIPCYLTMSEPDRAREAYKEIVQAKTSDNNLDAKMIADYFDFVLITAPGSKVKKPQEQIRKEAAAWLKSKNLASFGGTPEGYGVFIRVGGADVCFVPSTALDVRHAVTFELAKVLVGEAAAVSKKNKAQAASLYKAAQGYLNELQDTENDLTPQAQGLHLRVFVAMRGGKIDIEQLKTFRDLTFLARHNIEVYRQAGSEKEQKASLHGVAEALTRALDAADAKVSRRDLIKAGIDLTNVYLTLGDDHRAAVYGAYMAKTYPESTQATRAAGYALQAYARILSADAKLAKENVGDEVLTDEVLDRIQQGDRERFHRLASYIDKQEAWQDEAVSQYARYQLALEALGGGDFAEAIPLLSSIKPSWSGYQVARCQAVFAAMRLTRDEATRRALVQVLGFEVPYRAPLSEKEKKGYEQQILAAILKLPELPSHPTALAFRYHFSAHLEHCRILYREKKFAELEKVAGRLLQQLAKAVGPIEDLGEDAKEALKAPLRQGLEMWQKYALIGLAEQDYKAGKLDEVLTRLAPLVADVSAKVAQAKAAIAKMAEVNPIKDFLLQRDVLELAMRAYVEKNNIAEAKRIFDLLQDLASDPRYTESATGIKPTEILVSLVIQLKSKVQQLRLKGKPAQADLNKTIANFTAFLDVLNKDIDKLVKGMDAAAAGGNQKSLKSQLLLLLARSYASLDKHKEAAKLFARIKLPKNHTPDDLRIYLEAQVYYAQELIKGNALDDAQKVLQQEALNPDEKSVKLSLDMIFLTLEVKKLKVLLIEARKDYRKGYVAWTEFQKEPRLKSLLADRDFARMVARLKANDDNAMKRETDAIPPGDPAREQTIRTIEGKYRQMQNRTKDRLEKMYQDLVKMFFDAYYHKTYCVYKVSETITDENLKAKWIKTAATLIVRLEKASNRDGWNTTKEQFLLLLGNEPVLKKQYTELKNEAK